jgi:hypothetical protein
MRGSRKVFRTEIAGGLAKACPPGQREDMRVLTRCLPSARGEGMDPRRRRTVPWQSGGVLYRCAHVCR